MADLCLFIVGLCFGSFVNVLVWRILRGERIIADRSRCRYCHHLIRWRDNVPIISYLILTGRCRDCHRSISFSYPIVELLAGFMFLPLASYARGDLQMVIMGIAMITLLLALSLIDLKEYLIPDILSGGLGLLGFIFIPFNRMLGQSLGLRALEALGGFIFGGLILFLIAWVGSVLMRKEVLGGGDIKLLAALGMIFGWRGICVILLIASLLGSLIGLTLLAAKRLRKGEPLPFGPFLSFGAYIYFVSYRQLSHFISIFF